MSSEIDLIYREWQEAIRDRFNIKGEQVVVAKPSNPAHLSILKEMCLGAGFTSDQANSILLILEKDDEEEQPLEPIEKERAKKMGLVWKGKGYGKPGKGKGITHKNVDGKLVKVGGRDYAQDDEKEEEPDTNPNYAQPDEPRTDPSQTTSDGSHLTNEPLDDDNPQSKRERTISKVVDLFIPRDKGEGGAGRFNMTREDINAYKEYLKLTPEEREAKQREIVEKQKEKIGEVTEEDIDAVIAELKDKLSPKEFQALKASIKKKGDPPGEMTKGEAGNQRFRNVIRHYLETGGVNPINGNTVPFSEAQLDHITSLDNGGKDEGANWMWMEAKFNQFKGSLTDAEVEAKLIERGMRTVNELDRDMSEAELKNWQTEAEISYWQTRFEKNDIANLSEENIEKMNADELNNLVKAWNRYVGEGDPRYIARYGSRKVKIGDKDYEISRSGHVKPDKNNPDTWGVQKQPDGSLKKTDMTYEEAMALYDKARASGGSKISKDEVKENIINALTGSQSPFKDEEGNTISIPSRTAENVIAEEFESIQAEKKKRKDEITRLKKAIKDNPLSAENARKEIEKDPIGKDYKARLKAAAGKGGKKKPDNPEEYAKIKQEYDEWVLSKWKEWDEKQNPIDQLG